MLSMIVPLVCGAALPVADIPKPPTASPEGEVHVWGSPQFAEVAHVWAEAFEQRHPGIDVKLHMTGSDVALAGLYTGRADIALVGRDATSSEAKAFEWIFRYKPHGIPVANGSRNRPGQSPDVQLLVLPDNPLASLSEEQMARVLLEPRLTWRDLGSEGAIADEPVRVYFPSAESGTGSFIRAVLVGGEIGLDWDRVVEFADPSTQGHVDVGTLRASEALASDRTGIAFGLSGIQGTRELWSLTRTVYAYVNQAPEREIDRETAAFLEFVGSTEGQDLMRSYSALRPLSANAQNR